MKKTKKRWWDVWAAFFLLAAIIAAADRLVLTKWTAHLDLPAYIAFFSAILGLALGQSKFSKNLASLFGFLYGLIIIPWLLTVNMTFGSVWSERLFGLIGRLGIAANQVLTNRPVTDNILFITLMALLYWLLGVTAGYHLVRYASPWAALLPTGVVLLVINHYDRLQRSGFRLVLIYLFFALLVIGRETFLHYRSEWQESNVFQSPEVGTDLTRAALVAGLVLIVVAWNVPVTSAEGTRLAQIWQNFSRPWESVRETFSNAFSSLRASVVEVNDTYGNTMSLGTGANLGNQVLFTVKPAQTPQTGVRLYWWARSYDTYQSGQWNSTASKSEFFTASTFTFTYPDWTGRQIMTFTFYPQIAQQLALFTGPIPLAITRPGEATLEYNPDGTADISTLTARPPIRAGEYYQARSWLSAPTVMLLRSSGSNYPAWVDERYLQLPKNLPADISLLAREITSGMNNPYDKANAITNWLRQNITYREQLPKPPAGKDPLEWFLFDIKQGYCNYYASSEVIMLRTLGIPARLGVGYAQGTYDDITQRYVVVQKDSHAWPEVFFGGVGWVEFEPTVSQPQRELPLGSPNASLTLTPGAAAGNQEPLPPTPFPGAGQTFNPDALNKGPNLLVRFLIWAGIILLFSILFFLYWYYARPRLPKWPRLPLPVVIESNLARRGRTVPGWITRWSWHTRLSPFEKTYIKLEQVIKLLGKKVEISETPTERVARLVELLPEASAPAGVLLSEYQQNLFSRNPGNLDQAQKAVQQIRRLAYFAFFRRLLTNRQ